jgi:hypothetical protein
MPFLPSRRMPAVIAVVVIVVVQSALAGARQDQAPTAFEREWQRGTPASVTGVLTVVQADDFKNGRTERLYFLQDRQTGQSLRVQFEKAPPADLRTGTVVRLAGRASGQELYVLATQTDSTSSAATPTTVEVITQPLTSPSSDHRTLVMVANFRDAAVTCNMQCVSDTMFTDPNGLSVANLYLTNSLGKVSLSGDVVGPYVLEASSTDICDLGAWASAADARAVAAGIDITAYQHKVYVMPPSSCTAGGYGMIGGNPTGAWIFQADLVGVFAHELGHNLGMNHASTPTSEYDDSTDPMAISSNRLRGVNAPHRQQLGWLGPASVAVVTQDGTYEVAPLALDPAAATAPQVLMIRKPDTDEYYYLSYRLLIGFDSFIDGSYSQRLNVHRYKGDGQSTRTFRLAGLANGESFVDQINGVTITMVSHDSTHATASVAFTCGAASPSLVVSPQLQSGLSGSSLSYALSLMNRDSAGCPSSTFALGSTVPSGWMGTVSSASLTLAPGAIGGATLTVTSAAGAAAGAYAPAISVTDAGQAAHAVSTSVTYNVSPPPDTVPPTSPAALKASTSQKIKQVQLSWTAASDNVAVTGYRVRRNGTVLAVTTSAGWMDATSVAGTTYTYDVEAYDAAGNVSPRSNSATITTSNGKRR